MRIAIEIMYSKHYKNMPMEMMNSKQHKKVPMEIIKKWKNLIDKYGLFLINLPRNREHKYIEDGYICAPWLGIYEEGLDYIKDIK